MTPWLSCRSRACTADITTDGTIVEAFEKRIPSLGIPAGYSLDPAGKTRELARTARGFMIAFGLSFLFMYLILAAQFESWLHPVTILVSLPLTVPFALVSLILFGQSLDIFSCLGILVLFGVVKKNSILQIEHTNHLRATGMSRPSSNSCARGTLAPNSCSAS